MVLSVTGGVVNAILDPVFSPLLSLEPWLAIAIISFFISLFVTLIYKFTTDQDLMKSLKAEMKELQKEMKELRSHPEKMAKVQSEFMQTNMKYMMKSMKSTLFTIIPVILIFGWLTGHMAYLPLKPDVPFHVTANFDDAAQGGAVLSVIPTGGLQLLVEPEQQIRDGEAVWNLRGPAGEYVLDITYGEESGQADVLISEGRLYLPPETKVGGKSLEKITISNEKLIYLNVFGWEWGWLGTYILFAMIFSISMRRVLKLA